MSDIKYTIKPVIYCRYRNLSAEFRAFISLTKGLKEMSPTAAQWQLDVKILVNDNEPDFDLVENILSSFLVGEFHLKSRNVSYEQTKFGFTAMYAPEHLQGLGMGKRREIRSVNIEVNLKYLTEISSFLVFPEVLRSLNYGFTSLMSKIERIAPLVFDVSKCRFLKNTIAYLRPIALTLGNGDTDKLERILERGVLKPLANSISKSKSKSGVLAPNNHEPKFRWIYFPEREFEDHMFMDIGLSVTCEHEVCFINDLVPLSAEP